MISGAWASEEALVDLLERPHDPNASDSRTGETLLLAAARQGYGSVVSCLLDAGADKDSPPR